MAWFYILYSRTLDRYCIGHTAEALAERLRKHQSYHRDWSARAKDWQVVHYEQHSDKVTAYRREREVKGWKSRDRIRSMSAEVRWIDRWSGVVRSPFGPSSRVRGHHPSTFGPRSIMPHQSNILFLCGAIFLAACAPTPDEDQEQAIQTNPIMTMDHHSHARPDEARITHLDLDVIVDMTEKRISGTAHYDIEVSGGDRIVFDTDGLKIDSVKLGDGSTAQYVLGDSTFLGRPLTVMLPVGAKRLSIAYSTGAGARALQWLRPEQTADRTHPFLFTQGQAILTRTWIPVQDSPGIRFTYNATVRVPKELMAVMSATNPTKRSSDGSYSFKQERAIPAYLIALAVGDLEFAPIGERTGVYAERSVVKKAAWEFADVERMLESAEALYGPYRWGRYDLIVLPPSFPFGGMENPCLTFATPTIIAGDRSLTALVAHELAHSWSGNLVTNATWNDFWLNEGFTVYFEHRICEVVYGPDRTDMQAVLGIQDLRATMHHLEADGHGADTHLRLDLAGRNPDDGMNEVAYEKGCALLRTLEDRVGRPAFDAFLREYFDTFAFQSMTTDRFVEHLRNKLLDPNKIEFDIAAWIDGPGLPPDAVLPHSDRFTMVEAELARWVSGTPASQLNTADWGTFEWMHFLRHLPQSMSDAQMTELDQAFGFSDSGNAELLVAWLENCIRNDHDESYAKLDSFLNRVGRRKYLVPLYTALIETEKGRLTAQTIYRSARPNYHAVSVRTLDDLLAWRDNKPPATF